MDGKECKGEQQDANSFCYPNTDLSVWLRTCHSEVREPLEGILTFGKVPIWISGSLIRNGPGGINAYGQEDSCKHLFDAPGLLQKFQLSNGSVTYSSRFIQSNSYIKNLTAKRLVLSEFGTVATPDPCQTIFARIAAIFLGPLESTMSDNANISIHPFGDEIYSLSEFPFAHRIQIDNLETIKTVNVHDELGVINHSAHPHILGRKIYNMGQKLSLWHGPHYIIAELERGRGMRSRTRRASNSPQHATGLQNAAIRSRSASVATTITTNPTNSGTSSLASSRTNLTSLNPFETESLTDLSTLKQNPPNSPWENAKIVASIPSRWPLSLCYMHTFSVTQNYFVLIEQPLAIFLPTVPLNQISGNKPLSSCLKFYKEEDTIFHVVSKHGKRRRSASSGSKSRKSFKTPSFFFLHTINAFEMRDSESRETLIVVDICCYKDPSMIECMYVDALKKAQHNENYANMFRGRPKRFLIKLDEFDKHKQKDKHALLPTVECEMIVDIGCETPKINDNFNGKPYNFFYAISSDVDRDNPGTLIKVDVLKKNYDTWCEKNAYPSEPIFVPRPSSQREDDGVVLSTVVYGGESVNGPNKTSLIILNATSWDLVAKVDFMVESSVPKCLHGWYFPNKDAQTNLKTYQSNPFK